MKKPATVHLDYAYARRPSTIQSRLPSRGFSLIELVVTVALIAVLTGILTTFALMHGANMRRTQLILLSARGVAEEYYAKTDQPVEYVWAPGAKDIDSIEAFVKVARQLPEAEKMFGALGKEVYTNSNGNTDSNNNPLMEILDGWGRPVRYFENNFNGSESGYDPTIMTYPQPFFASRGKDGQWGDISKPEGTSERTMANDNVYSFNVELE